jgi:EmrB/QacA subfamily drug resistance transporter
MTSKQKWILVLAAMAAFMTALDTLVVTTALSTIQRDLGASVEGLEWTVNAYNLSFAVLLMTAAALGDRLGRRRVFAAGIGLFVVASAACAVAPSVGALIAARALQGAGAAIVMPLTLTLISEAFPTEKRGVAIGLWGGIQGLAVAAGPVVGGAIAGGISWHWIFWLNVPIGLALMPLAARRLSESFGPRPQLDVGGLVLAAAAAFAITWGLVRAEAAGWTSAEVLGALGAGLVLGTSFIRWERRTPTPMLQLALFRDRTFATANAVSFFSFGALFGTLFLMAQFFQIALGHSPLHAGLELLPWTGAPMIVAPIAGALSERYGNRPFMAAGLALQTIGLTWVALIAEPGMGYLQLGVALTIAGIGISLCFPTVANAVMGAVPLQEAGVASGTNSMLRELGGVLGIAVLASVFASHGGYTSPAVFVDGFTKALWVGVGLSAAGCVAALLAPGRSVAAVGALVPTHPEAALDLS